ncbi:hypothetical protein chiPu_0029612 [Chiloscyllium punctatum]|uniref:Uncharacterized protein n=1 Tax=Chiloscyllium punctatum TaxID=137246 RepID=A0A401TS99_CHIPU|nr:hypothetical protein [Chiloscyllium punctatum]
MPIGPRRPIGSVLDESAYEDQLEASMTQRHGWAGFVLTDGTPVHWDPARSDEDPIRPLERRFARSD